MATEAPEKTAVLTDPKKPTKAGGSGKSAAKKPSKAGGSGKTAAKQRASDASSLASQLEALLQRHYGKVNDTWLGGEAEARKAYDRCVGELQTLAAAPWTSQSQAKVDSAQQEWLGSLSATWERTQRSVGDHYRASLQDFVKVLAAAQPEELDPTTLWSVASALAGVATQVCAFGVGREDAGQ